MNDATKAQFELAARRVSVMTEVGLPLANAINCAVNLGADCITEDALKSYLDTHGLGAGNV